MLTQIELYCETVPRAAENFLGLCASGKYDDVKWHRNMRNFMIQTGDPTGTGKGGESIWGGTFDDEIRPTLKFNARGVVAMANRAPNTNGAQVRVLLTVLHYIQQAAPFRWSLHDHWQGDLRRRGRWHAGVYGACAGRCKEPAD